jgi:hypothetical protein
LPYFFIAPAFVFYLLVGGVLLLVARFTKVGRSMLPFAWRLFFWSTLGVVVANAVFLTAVILFVNSPIFPNSDTMIAKGVGVTTGLGVLLGPFVATGLGLVGGAVFGLVLALRTRRIGHAAPA